MKEPARPASDKVLDENQYWALFFRVKTPVTTTLKDKLLWLFFIKKPFSQRILLYRPGRRIKNEISG